MSNVELKRRGDSMARRIAQSLVGRMIVDVRGLTRRELDAHGWDRPGFVIVLDNHAQVTPLMDEEGNGPGTLSIS